MTRLDMCLCTYVSTSISLCVYVGFPLLHNGCDTPAVCPGGLSPSADFVYERNKGTNCKPTQFATVLPPGGHQNRWLLPALCDFLSSFAISITQTQIPSNTEMPDSKCKE